MCYELFYPLIPKSDMVLNSPQDITPEIKVLSHENTGNDQQLMKLLMVLQILHLRTKRMHREQYREHVY